MEETSQKPSAWKWIICGMLFLALVLNYMDRQTLSQTKTKIVAELNLNNKQYGQLEWGFGWAFASGALFYGILADKVNIRWLYPAALVGWSLAGFCTAFADRIGRELDLLLTNVGLLSAQSDVDPQIRSTFVGFMFCRVTLGFFESGQWPCALVTTQRLLSRQDRSFGNSLLQSGASIGAIATPIVIQFSVTDAPGTWRVPFMVVGAVGLLWIIPWFWLIGKDDLKRVDDPSETNPTAADAIVVAHPRGTAGSFFVRYAILVILVLAINTTWHFFRAWLPSWLGEYHQYKFAEVNGFTSLYYIFTDVGCIASGAAVTWLAKIGWDVHRARTLSFSLCALLTSLSLVAANLPKGPLLLGVLLLVAAGSLGLFPHYYAFTQELSSKHQGKMTGTLGAIAWFVTATMHPYIGNYVDRTKSYSEAIMLVGLAPVIACVPLWLFWNVGTKPIAEK